MSINNPTIHEGYVPAYQASAIPFVTRSLIPDGEIHEINNKTITIPAGGSVLLDGGVSLVLAAGAIAKFVWTGIDGNGSWVQTSKAITAI